MDSREISDENNLIKYFILLLLIPFIVFFPLELIWSDDPFQKVVLAPLGEEPLKLLIASLLCYVFFKSLNCSKKNCSFNYFFLYSFVIFSIIAGLSVGIGEGYISNILLHISSSSIGAILILFVYLKIKNKNLKNRYKLVIMSITLIVPMFIHSLSNQFLNITYANNHPSFNYLVVIGRFLSGNASSNDTLQNYCFLFNLLVFIIAILFVIVWYFYLIYQRKKLQ